jgi:cyclohexa-1,5-dienecarbonyl-CoA hydratase
MTVGSTIRVQTEIRGMVARITLNHPPLNVFDLATAKELSGSLTALEERKDVSTIVFEGSSRAFSAGVDIKAHLPEAIVEMLTSFNAVIRAIVASRKITIAMVSGTCLGGGAELASVCDIVYTARDATWGFPEITLGCYPPVAAVALSALVGQKRASELIFTGRKISGEEAAAIGLASRAARAEELENVLQSTLGELERMSPVALAHVKKAVYTWDALHFDKGLARAEKIYLEEVISTSDAREGIIAFLEKRAPKWTNQ